MDNDTLQALLEEWQERLGLQNWDIRARLVTNRELADYHGDATITLVNEQASIRILSPEHYELDDSDFPHDPERTLVHELLHLLWAQWDDFDDGSSQDQLSHQTLDRLSRVLVKLKRRGEAECPVQ